MDYYLQNPEALEGQPKRTIADYVEQNGILVPRRFDSLVEARKSHRRIFLRSEHPQEYAGVSGLLDSFGLSNSHFTVRGSSDVEEAKQRYFKKEDDTTGTPKYKQYCKFLGIDEDEFRQKTSFSVWESLGGANRTVIADSAIPNRYHVMTFRDKKGNHLYNYTIVEDGKSVQEFVMPLPEELKDGIGDLVGDYEQVRNLDRFDSNHCPIMEFQTVKGKNYFLQYHRARDFSPSDFSLERALQDGEVEVPFVRGATSKDGMDCKVTVYYAGQSTWDFNPDIEDGSYDLNYNFVFSELRVRDRKVQMIESRDFKFDLMKFVVDHLPRSKLFKPQVSIIHNIEDVMNGESVSDFYERTKEGRNSYVDLNIVSDGRKAFVRRI